ncbi:MAG: S8 family serine peptidase [Oscillospiraceae bacterium]|nr:S8 family serine peptidase [Oscillospiraceae bacterium]
MKRFSHKLLSVLLVLCMVLPLYAVPASAAETERAQAIDYQFETVSPEEVHQSAEKLSFDPFSPLQWDMKMIGMDRAWESGLTGKGVRVGVIDSGVSNVTLDISASRILKGKNLSNASGIFASPTVDAEGHGTFVSGIIGASRGNGVSIAGVAPEVTIVPIKTLSREAEAIRACVDEYQCDVINMSFGGPYDTQALREAIQYAASKGVVLVAAVGNDGDAVLQYPAAYSEVVGVGAVDKNMAVCDFSNRNDSVFVTAPGDKVLSLGPAPLLVYRSSGTSFSAPFVTGLAALLKQAHPDMTTEDFKAILQASSEDLGDAGYDTAYGWGLVQAPEAIAAAQTYFGGAGDPAQTPDDAELPLDQRFEDVEQSAVSESLPKLTFDPFSALQWDMKMIGMDRAWKSGLTGAGVRVAIIDTGVSVKTKDIDSSRLLAGKNLVDASQSTDDTNGHGTFIAGIIGATKGNGVGIAGVAPGVTIVPIKTSDDGHSNTSINAKAVYAAVDEFHCDVINMSMGSLNGSPTLHAAIQYAASKGVIIVCSTGNEGNANLHYPGAYEETIGVGFVTITKNASYFSHKNESIFVTAPGSGVVSLSTVPYIAHLGSGSSYAAPFVTGLAALLKERYPQMTKDDFAEILKQSSKDLGDAGYDTTYGWGLVQVPEAISTADAYFAETPADPEPAPVAPESKPSVLSGLRDVLANSWFYQAVQYVTEHRYMNGMSAETFAPQGLVTRAQVAQILYNMENRPAFTQRGAFSDTAKSAWYYAPVMWAESTGLVSGYPDGSFRPDAPITREQMATILQRYARWKGMDVTAANSSARFADLGAVSGYARAAMQWATAIGVMKGDGAGRLNPGSSATRAEIAAMLMNFDNSRK